MTEIPSQPILRVMPGPADINANGHIFGGWVLGQMDMAAGIVARLHSGGAVATVAIERMEFIAPVHLRDLISVYADVESVGRTSMKVRIEVMAWRNRGATEVKAADRIKVTEGLFTFVAIDDQARPRPVRGLSPAEAEGPPGPVSESWRPLSHPR
jgi:acyl-CoA thioesterase YciA